MYLMYVDESGDPGVTSSPTSHFFLSGIVLHELHWKQVLDELVKFRRQIRERTGFKVRDEIHAQVMIAGRKSKNRNIEPHIRLLILKECLRWLARKEDIRIITVVVEKARQPDPQTVFRIAWETLIQRFENTLIRRNFPGSTNSEDRGLIIPDNTNGELLNQIVRKMRRFNPISDDADLYPGQGYRNLPLNSIVEDPFTKDSADSLFLQMADVVAYFAQQLYKPNKYTKKANAKNFYKILDPVLLKAATKRHPLGIVER